MSSFTLDDQSVYMCNTLTYINVIKMTTLHQIKWQFDKEITTKEITTVYVPNKNAMAPCHQECHGPLSLPCSMLLVSQGEGSGYITAWKKKMRCVRFIQHGGDRRIISSLGCKQPISYYCVAHPRCMLSSKTTFWCGRSAKTTGPIYFILFFHDEIILSTKFSHIPVHGSITDFCDLLFIK